MFLFLLYFFHTQQYLQWELPANFLHDNALEGIQVSLEEGNKLSVKS